MVFNQNQKVDTRVAVLEERFTIYEKMMGKLENAIQTISEINQNISRMLTAHEEKIETNGKNDDIIFDKFKRMEEKNSQEHQKVVEKIEKLEEVIQATIKKEVEDRETEIDKVNTKLSGLTKFRWLFVGGIAVVVFLISNLTIVIDILTPDQATDKLEKVK